MTSFTEAVAKNRERFGLENSFVADPLVLAMETATFLQLRTATQSQRLRRAFALRAGNLLPSSSTPLERGLAVGMALALVTEGQ